MNGLLLDYSKKKPLSKKRKRGLLITGVILIGADLILLVYALISSQTKFSLILPPAANMLIGTLLILEAFEHKILRPTKYIHITSECIEFKLGRIYSLYRIEWSSVDRIEIKANSVHIYSGENHTKMKMMHFPSSDEKRIKGTIKAIAEARNVAIYSPV